MANAIQGFHRTFFQDFFRKYFDIFFLDFFKEFSGNAFKKTLRNSFNNFTKFFFSRRFSGISDFLYEFLRNIFVVFYQKLLQGMPSIFSQGFLEVIIQIWLPNYSHVSFQGIIQELNQAFNMFNLEFFHWIL